MTTSALVNPWLALESGADPVERVRALRRAHAAFVGAGQSAVAVRRVVGASWRRSLRARVDPDASGAPIDLVDSALAAYRATHPLARALPLLRDVLGGSYDTGDQLMAVTDAAGRLLWVEGRPEVRRRAEAMNFVAGAWWDERHVGTNAPGTALAVDHAVQIFAAEHFNRAVQRWTCSAAPIHDPRTGWLLGAVDITGGDQVANPHSLALVQAAARLAETYLARGPGADPADDGAGISVTGLGQDEATISLHGQRVLLSRRHSEILVLLVCHPEGLTGERLGLELYGDVLNPVTLRAELSRLRRLLGPDLLDSRPYRLRAPVRADFLTVTRLLDAGALREALAAYRGPLLPGSAAPGVLRLRSLLDQQARAAVLASRDASLLAAWTRSPTGADDLAVWEALALALPAGSSQRAMARVGVAELRVEYGLTPSLYAAPTQATSGRAISTMRATLSQPAGL
jgi:hypothetical protein